MPPEPLRPDAGLRPDVVAEPRQSTGLEAEPQVRPESRRPVGGCQDDGRGSHHRLEHCRCGHRARSSRTADPQHALHRAQRFFLTDQELLMQPGRIGLQLLQQGQGLQHGGRCSHRCGRLMDLGRACGRRGKYGSLFRSDRNRRSGWTSLRSRGGSLRTHRCGSGLRDRRTGCWDGRNWHGDRSLCGRLGRTRSSRFDVVGPTQRDAQPSVVGIDLGFAG